MTRWKAAGIHLAISAVIGAAILALLFWVWYPAPYFKASGGQHLILILLGVDLIMGPLLTLILFKLGKKGLVFDLAMVAVLQLGALLYGLHVMAISRPAFIVAVVDRFNVLTGNEIDPADLAQGMRPEFRSISWTGPRLVGTSRPTDPNERLNLAISGAAGKDAQHMPKYYVDYADNAAALAARAKPLSALRSQDPRTNRIIDAWLASSGRAEAEVVWLPLQVRGVSMSMLLERSSGNVIDALPVDPW